MKVLSHDETVLVGGWLTEPSGRVVADDVSQRIEWLIKQSLDHVAFSTAFGAWETLFRDPLDGRLWERTYPQGHLQGGGPPMLRFIEPEEARTKYGIM
jgi:hypothetical protein